MGTKTDYRADRLKIGDRFIEIDDNRFDVNTPEGRMAVRAFAWTVAADGDKRTRDRLLAVVGRTDG